MFVNIEVNWLKLIQNSLAGVVSNAAKSIRVTPFLTYKLLFLINKVLTTIEPACYYSMISLQPPCSTLTSSVVTLSGLPTDSLKITDRSFVFVIITILTTKHQLNLLLAFPQPCGTLDCL